MGIEELKGKTLVKITRRGDDKEVIFEADDGTCYRMWHDARRAERETVKA